MKLDRVVFCDFDGTITTEDTFVRVLNKFNPEVSAKLLPLIFERKMTLKDGIKQTIGSIPAIYYPEIIEYIASHPIRPGFIEFADFLKDLEIPLVVISGGLTDIVEAVLAEMRSIEGKAIDRSHYRHSCSKSRQYGKIIKSFFGF